MKETTKRRFINEAREQAKENCVEYTIEKAADIMMQSGIGMTTDFGNIERMSTILFGAVEGLSALADTLPDDLTDFTFGMYTPDCKTVKSIVASIESLDSCVKCTEEVINSIIDILNHTLQNWLIFALYRSGAKGIIDGKYNLYIDTEKNEFAIVKKTNN